MWLYSRLVDPSFDRAETEAGAKAAYCYVAALAFGSAGERGDTELRQLCSAEVLTKLREAAEQFGGSSLTFNEVVCAELIHVFQYEPKFQYAYEGTAAARVGFDIRCMCSSDTHTAFPGTSLRDCLWLQSSATSMCAPRHPQQRQIPTIARG